jgi:hypothetical protein
MPAGGHAPSIVRATACAWPVSSKQMRCACGSSYVHTPPGARRRSKSVGA